MILLDTCAVLWDAIQPKKLSSKARKAIEDADQKQKLLVSDISLWEIAMLCKKRRVLVDEAPAEFLKLILDARNFEVVPISPLIAGLSVDLDSRVNGDPADRLITATALALNASLVTADQNLKDAGLLKVIW